MVLPKAGGVMILMDYEEGMKFSGFYSRIHRKGIRRKGIYFTWTWSCVGMDLIWTKPY
jgi:hypothetical protein